MSGSTDQEIHLNGTLPSEFKLVIVPFYGSASAQTQGVAVNVDQSTVTLPTIPVPLASPNDGSVLVSMTVIYQMGCVLTSIPGINIPADNRTVHLHFIQTGCVNFLTVGEPLNSLPECCDIH